MKNLLIPILLLIAFFASGQTYNPSGPGGTPLNRPIALTGKPDGARTYLYDAVNFTYRAFVSLAEANAYITGNSRKGSFYVMVNTGGTLLNGVIIGGTNAAYWWRDGIADSDLVPMIAAAGSTNTSVGGGFRLAINGTNNIKSIVADLGTFAAIDSSTPNVIRISVDTTDFIIYLQTHHPYKLIAQSPLGVNFGLGGNPDTLTCVGCGTGGSSVSGPISWVANIDSVLAYKPSDGIIFHTNEYHAGNGVSTGSAYQWNASSTATPDNHTIYQATVGGTGRWFVRPINNAITLRQLGIFPSSDNTADLITAKGWGAANKYQIVVDTFGYVIDMNAGGIPLQSNINWRGIGYGDGEKYWVFVAKSYTSHGKSMWVRYGAAADTIKNFSFQNLSFDNGQRPNTAFTITGNPDTAANGIALQVGDSVSFKHLRFKGFSNAGILMYNVLNQDYDYLTGDSMLRHIYTNVADTNVRKLSFNHIYGDVGARDHYDATAPVGYAKVRHGDDVLFVGHQQLSILNSYFGNKFKMRWAAAELFGTKQGLEIAYNVFDGNGMNANGLSFGGTVISGAEQIVLNPRVHDNVQQNMTMALQTAADTVGGLPKYIYSNLWEIGSMTNGLIANNQFNNVHFVIGNQNVNTTMSGGAIDNSGSLSTGNESGTANLFSIAIENTSGHDSVINFNINIPSIVIAQGRLMKYCGGLGVIKGCSFAGSTVTFTKDGLIAEYLQPTSVTQHTGIGLTGNIFRTTGSGSVSPAIYTVDALGTAVIQFTGNDVSKLTGTDTTTLLAVESGLPITLNKEGTLFSSGPFSKHMDSVSVTSGNLVTWRNGQAKTSVALPGGGASTLAGLTDVTIATPKNGQLATVYDSITAKYKNSQPPYYNVADWGILPDSTDIRAKLIKLRDYIYQTAIGSATIYFPGGPQPYYLSDSVIFTKSIHLIGVSASGGLHNFQSGGITPQNRLGPVQYSSNICVLNGKNGFIFDSAANGTKPTVEVEHMTFTSTVAPGTSATSTFIILRGMIQDPSIHDCTFYGGYIGIDKQSAYYSRINYNHFSAQRKAGLKMQNTVRTDTGDDIVFGDFFNSGTFNTAADGTVALWWTSGGGLKFSGFKIDACEFDTLHGYQYGIKIENPLDPTSDIMIHHGSIENCTVSGIIMRGLTTTYVRNVLVDGVQIAPVGSRGPAIDINLMEGVQVVNFDIRDWNGSVAAPAIKVTNCDKVTIGDGIIRDYTSNYDITGSTNVTVHYKWNTYGIQAIANNNIIAADNLQYNGTQYITPKAGHTSGFIFFNGGAYLVTDTGTSTAGAQAKAIEPLYAIKDTITVTHLKITSGASNGKVLTSDDNGLASWQTGGGGTPGGSTTNVQFNDAGSFNGDAAYVWDNTNKRVTIGGLTPTYPNNFNIAKSAAYAGIGIENPLTTGREESFMVEDANKYMGFGRFNSGVSTNWGGTSIPQAQSGYFYTADGAYIGSRPFVVHGNPVYGLPGETTTNLGYRMDSIGFRIGAISGLHTTNTVPLEVPGLGMFTKNSAAMNDLVLVKNSDAGDFSGSSIRITSDQGSSSTHGTSLQMFSSGTSAGFANSFLLRNYENGPIVFYGPSIEYGRFTTAGRFQLPVYTAPNVSLDTSNYKLAVFASDGTIKESSWQAAGGGGSSSPLTTNGDLYIRSGGVDARLPIGTSSQHLVVVSGLPAWRDTATGPSLVFSVPTIGVFGAASTYTFTYTTPNDGTSHFYDIGANFVITTTGGNLTTTVGYTDPSSNARTVSFFPQGSTSAAVSAAGLTNYPASSSVLVKANTNIVYTCVTTGSMVANASLTIVKLN